MKILEALEVNLICGNSIICSLELTKFIHTLTRFLDRSLNATEMALGINSALHGDEKYKWFID